MLEQYKQKEEKLETSVAELKLDLEDAIIQIKQYS